MPLDAINEMKGKEVIVKLCNGEEIIGVLRAFDLQSNVGIEVKGELIFVQGGNAESVALK